LAGIAGLVYVVGTALRSMKLTTYQPDGEDWTWHVALPLGAYVLLLTGAIGLHADPSLALYAPAAAVTLLIFVGIHNAWDVVTFLALSTTEAPSERAADPSPQKPRD
jgi:hypothetical protein